MKFKKSLLLFLLFFWCLPLSNLHAAGFDHSSWDAFLKKYVNEKGDVNYQAVAKDPGLLDGYLKLLSSVDEKTISAEWPREEALAFWLNAYHAALIKQIADHYPVRTVQMVSSVWDTTILHVGESKYSLNDIRVNKLIKVYRDEKIHLALSLAAKSGPRLRQEAFTGPRAEGQLFLAARQFVNDPSLNQIIPGAKKIKISKLFKWYVNDFKLNFGSPESFGKFSQNETMILSFLAYYLENSDQIEYLQEGKYKIDYFPFDWALNDWKENASETSATPLPPKNS